MAYSREADWGYFRRLLMTVAVVAAAYAAWLLSGILLLAFAAVLAAVLLAGFADLIARYTRLPWPWALTIGTIAVIALLLGTLFLFGAQLAGQLDQLVMRIPQALDDAGRRLGIPRLYDSLAEAASSAAGGEVVSRAARLGYTFVGIATDLLLVLVTAIYLAADRNFHRNAIKLLPQNQHEDGLSTMTAIARALRLWFMGQLVSMVLVGVLSAVAFWFIGLPLPIGLGFIAGLTNFIPLVGPFIGGIPAMAIALSEGWNAVIWTALAIVVIQQLEGYVVMPLVQRRGVDLAPAVVLFAIAAFGVLFGLLGVVLAMPLTVVLMVLVQKLWMREVLGERVKVTGESQPPAV